MYGGLLLIARSQSVRPIHKTNEITHLINSTRSKLIIVIAIVIMYREIANDHIVPLGDYALRICFFFIVCKKVNEGKKNFDDQSRGKKIAFAILDFFLAPLFLPPVHLVFIFDFAIKKGERRRGRGI